MSWKPTPPELLLDVERFDPVSWSWTTCPFQDLKRGDIYRAFYNGQRIDPKDMTPTDEDIVALCTMDAMRSHPDVDGRGTGYCVEVYSGLFAEVVGRVAV